MSELEKSGMVEFIRQEGLDEAQKQDAYEVTKDHWASILRAQEAGSDVDEADLEAFTDMVTLEAWERSGRPSKWNLLADQLRRWTERRERVLGEGFRGRWHVEETDVPSSLSKGELVAVSDHSQMRFPEFQFASPEVRQRVAHIGWALGIPGPCWLAAEWWFTPNSAIDDMRPADVVNDDALTHRLVQTLLLSRPEPDEVVNVGLY